MKATNTTARTAVSALAGLTVAAAVAAPVAGMAVEAPSEAPVTGLAPQSQEAASTLVTSSLVKAPAVGTFSYDQTTVSSSADILKLQSAGDVLCGAKDARCAACAGTIRVTGDVQQEYVADLGELVAEEPESRLMTCSCGGNPAGGRAIVTADVKGVPVEQLLAKAGASRNANTLTFVAADGSEVSVPLGYAVGRHAVIDVKGVPVEQLLAKAGASRNANTLTFVAADGSEVSVPLGYAVGRHAVIGCELNGEDLYGAMGNTNQLWMAKTPANYFLKDVVEIVVSTEDEVPAAPGSDAERPNSPNAGILTGLQA